jgi:hypothetical protein
MPRPRVYFWANEFVGVRSKVAFNDDQVKALKEFLGADSVSLA